MEMPSSRLLSAVLLLQRIRAAQERVPARSDTYRRRQERMLQVGVLGLVIALLPWFFYTLWQGQTLAAGLYAVGLGLAGLQALLVRAKRPLAATLVLSLTAWLALTLVALWIDRPHAGQPRSVMFFCVPLYLAQRFLLLHEARALRRGVQGITLGLLVAWTALPDLLPPELPRLVSLADHRAGLAFHVWVPAALAAWLLRIEAAEFRDHKGLVLELAQAIAGGHLALHLQPQCDAEGQVHGVEALVRWQHPRLGPMSPARFIPLAEQHGLIVTLGEWVLREACRIAQGWQREPALRPLQVAVNVSAAQLLDAAAFERLLGLVAAAGLPAGTIKFELTESVFAAQAEAVQQRLLRCRAQGIPTSLDDFGTGYSSLSYLTELPFDQLKIDQSFVKGLGQDPRSERIAETVLALGERLGMTVIAEGVETAEQREILLAMGCRHFQGYWFSKPLPEPEFRAWLRSRT